MKVINFFGSPGAGKSTQAAGLFYLMKKNKYNVELVTEVAKEHVYEKNAKALSEQNYVFANQEYRLAVLRDVVDFVITDSPIILSNIYVKEKYPSSFNKFCFDMFKSYDNINFYIERNHLYSHVGRNQNEEEADEIGEKIKNFLHYYLIDSTTFVAGDNTPNEIYNYLIENKLI